MIIWENKIIDQFPTPKHQKIWLPFWKLLAFNDIERDSAKLLANHSALFSIVIDVIILIKHNNTWFTIVHGNIKISIL